MRQLSGFLAVAVAAAMLALPLNAQTCQQVNFPAGFDAGAIEGEVSPEGAVCYSLNMAPHDKNLGLRIEGRNVAFSFDDGFNAMDGQTETQLVPEGPNVRVTVTQMLRSAQTEPFRLSVTFLSPGNG